MGKMSPAVLVGMPSGAKGWVSVECPEVVGCLGLRGVILPPSKAPRQRAPHLQLRQRQQSLGAGKMEFVPCPVELGLRCSHQLLEGGLEDQGPDPG